MAGGRSWPRAAPGPPGRRAAGAAGRNHGRRRRRGAVAPRGRRRQRARRPGLAASRRPARWAHKVRCVAEDEAHSASHASYTDAVAEDKYDTLEEVIDKKLEDEKLKKCGQRAAGPVRQNHRGAARA